MEKLNELVELANNATGGDWFVEDWNEIKSGVRCGGGKGVVCSVAEYGSMDEEFERNLAFLVAANPATILTIAKAFREMEKEAQKNLECAFAWQNRAEAAEAKLAELEKQEPVKLPQIIQIGYTHDEITAMCNVRNDAVAAIRAAGYQVESE